MKAQNAERKLRQHGLQHGDQPCFADLRRRTHYLPLRYFIHRIDVIRTFDSVLIALMYRVHAPPITRTATPAARRARRSPILTGVGLVGW